MDGLSVGFCGGGRVTRLLLGGWFRAGELPRQVFVYDPDPAALEKLRNIIEGRLSVADSNRSVTQSSDLVFLAVHPQVAAEVCQEICGAIREKAILVSLVPTISLARLSGLLGGFQRLVRMIPNAPSIIGRGYNPVVWSKAIAAEERAALERLFWAWGKTPEVPEAQLEAYAVITGMGPTYFWFQFLELERLARQFGLPPSEAGKAVEEMLIGALATLYESGLRPEAVLDLIPVHPLRKDEDSIRSLLNERLTSLYQKLKAATV